MLGLLKIGLSHPSYDAPKKLKAMNIMECKNGYPQKVRQTMAVWNSTSSLDPQPSKLLF
jgi:hypothetical protein